MTKKTKPVSPYADVKKIYRLVDEITSNGYADEWGDYHGYDYRVRIIVKAYNVIRATPCGVWIIFHGEERFVNLTCAKCFGYETVERAVNSFMHRKTRQVRLLESQLKQAEVALSMAKHIDMEATDAARVEFETQPSKPGEFYYDPSFKPKYKPLTGFDAISFGSVR